MLFIVNIPLKYITVISSITLSALLAVKHAHVHKHIQPHTHGAGEIEACKILVHAHADTLTLYHNVSQVLLLPLQMYEYEYFNNLLYVSQRLRKRSS